jgi:hypothetical protein
MTRLPGASGCPQRRDPEFRIGRSPSGANAGKAVVETAPGGLPHRGDSVDRSRLSQIDREHQPDTDSRFLVNADTAGASGNNGLYLWTKGHRMIGHQLVTSTTPDALALALGKVIHGVRKSKGLSRKDVVLLFPDDDRPSVQTVATWELGTRAISVWRLWQLCELLGGPTVHEVLQEVHRRVVWVDNAIDLVDITGLTDPVLRPLRKWAAACLRSRPSLPRHRQRVPLDRAMVTSLAQVCRLTEADLVARLGPSFVRQPDASWCQTRKRDGHRKPNPGNSAPG